MGTPLRTWRDVRAEVLARIRSRHWKPGDLIPGEADLAVEFGCARATVNRALRDLADAGLLDRKRRAGTRVATHPVGKATVAIPILRQEVEARGQSYGYGLIAQSVARPPADVAARMRLTAGTDAMRVTALHLADGHPYALEDRWINAAALPQLAEADFATISPNEWLVANAPLSHGDIAFSAMAASSEIAELLGCDPYAALFVIDRDTWDADRSVTSVRLTFAPGYRMRTSI